MKIKKTIVEWLMVQGLGLWIWFGLRVLKWKCVDIYAPGGEDGEVEAITFTNNIWYSEAVGNIELNSDVAADGQVLN